MIPHVNGQQENIIDEDDIPFAIDNHKSLKWYDRVLLNRPLRIISVLLIATIAAPVLMYKFLFVPTIELPPPDGLSIGSCLVSREARLPCGLEAVPPLQCHEQCCYDHQHDLCYHRYPSRFSYLFRGDWSEETELYPRMLTLPYGGEKSYRHIKLSIDEISATHLTFTFYHSNNITGRRLTYKNYEYSVSEPNQRHPKITELNIVVNATQGNIFNTARGPLMAADNIWEMTFKLTNETMYGLGEIPLKPDTVKVLYNHKGGLNSVPLIFAKLNGSYHGLLIESLAPTEVIIRGDNQVVLRSITTLGLKFHLFVGPMPRDVMKDVRAVIGVKQDLEYWMLGAHICREGTSNDPLAELTTFLSLATKSLPFESHCGALPVVFQTDCNDTMVELVNQGEILLRNAGKKFVPHVSPYIKYTALEEPVEEESQEDSEEDGTTLTTTTTTTATPIERCFDDGKLGHYNIRDPDAYHLYKGKVDQQDVVYPGYYWASEEFMQNLWIYNTNFDAVILENNWPLDESEKDRDSFYDYLPYFNENFEAAFNVTPQWNATRPTRRPDSRKTRLTNDTEYPGEQYLMRHNEYGNQFIQAMEKIKGPVPMASTTQWMNGNVTINRQNITTTWTNLRRELVEASLGGVSGHWYWSSPICGDTEDFNNVTQIRLCAKWYMAATFMPLIKIHSKGIPRDPLGFVGNDRAHMIQALNRRLSLLPYIYTVLQDGPILRPMFYQFPSSNLTDLTTQFAFGDDLVIVPNLEPNQINIHFWMPPGEWYEFWGGLKISGAEGHAVTMSTIEADIFTMVRAGSIVIMQKETQLTANITRLQSGYSLIIALECETTYSTETTTETDSTESTITTEDDENTSSSATETTDVGIENDVTTEGDDTTVGTETTTDTDEDEEFSTTTETPLIAITSCEATGKLFMNENMTLIFKANATDVTITAKYKEEEDFGVFCNATTATWAGTVRELAIYGLNVTENNYDDKKLITSKTPLIDLCQLVDSDEVSYKFVD